MGATSWASSMLACQWSDMVSKPRKVTLGSAVAAERCRESRDSPSKASKDLAQPAGNGDSKSPTWCLLDHHPYFETPSTTGVVMCRASDFPFSTSDFPFSTLKATKRSTGGASGWPEVPGALTHTSPSSSCPQAWPCPQAPVTPRCSVTGFSLNMAGGGRSLCGALWGYLWVSAPGWVSLHGHP